MLIAGMADDQHGFPAVNPGPRDAPRLVLPLPALPPDDPGIRLDYYRPIIVTGTGRWCGIGRFPTTAKWHQARAALGRGHIEPMMGEGEDVGPNADPNSEGIALYVRQGDVTRALAILDAVKMNRTGVRSADRYRWSNSGCPGGGCSGPCCFWASRLLRLRDLPAGIADIAGNNVACWSSPIPFVLGLSQKL